MRFREEAINSNSNQPIRDKLPIHLMRVWWRPKIGSLARIPLCQTWSKALECWERLLFSRNTSFFILLSYILAVIPFIKMRNYGNNFRYMLWHTFYILFQDIQGALQILLIFHQCNHAFLPQRVAGKISGDYHDNDVSFFNKLLNSLYKLLNAHRGAHICTHAHTNTYTQTQTHTHTHTHTNTHKHTQTHTNTHKHSYTHIMANMQTYMQFMYDVW